MNVDSTKAIEWLLQAATSAVFLIPGYLVVRFLHTTRETRTADNFELSIQSLIFSLLIGGTWLYLTPPGLKLASLVATQSPILPKLLDGWAVFRSLAWLAAVAIIVAVIFAKAHHYRLYWWALEKVGFGRLNGYITTWEELADHSANRWVSVETNTGQTYIGLISALTPHPHERSLILTRDADHPIQIFKIGERALCDTQYVWLAGDNIKSIGVFPDSTPVLKTARTSPKPA